MSLSSALDPYERKARLFPALLVLAPITLGGSSWIQPSLEDLPILGGFGAFALVGATLLAQLARDEGKRKEKDLFARWGGKPSVVALSYRAGKVDPATLKRVHQIVRQIDSDIILPLDPSDELVDPTKFATEFEKASDLIRGRTRDKEKFAALFRENMNYGFRRNLWAMKTTGIAASLMGVLSGAGRLILEADAGKALSNTAVCSLLLGTTLLVFWLLRVNESWVRLVAEAYAQELIFAAEQLSSSS